MRRNMYVVFIAFLALTAMTFFAGCAKMKANKEIKNGDALLKEGKFDEAIGEYTKAIELFVDNEDKAEAYNNRGVAKGKKGDYDGAIADYTKAIELKPDYATAYHNRGYAFFKNNDFENAEKDFDAAINLTPNLGLFYKGKGILRLYQEQFDDAYKLFREAVELDGNLKKDIAEDEDIILWLCAPANKDKAQEVRDEIDKIIAPEQLKECPKRQK